MPTAARAALVAQAVTGRFSVLMTGRQTLTAIALLLYGVGLLHCPHRLKRSLFALANSPSKPQAAQRLAASTQPPHEVCSRLLVGVVGHLWEHRTSGLILLDAENLEEHAAVVPIVL